MKKINEIIKNNSLSNYKINGETQLLSNYFSPIIDDKDKIVLKEYLNLKFGGLDIAQPLTKHKLSTLFAFALADNYTKIEFKTALEEFLKSFELYGTIEDAFVKLNYTNIFKKELRPELITFEQFKLLYKENPNISKDYERWEIKGEIMLCKKGHNFDMTKIGKKPKIKYELPESKNIKNPPTKEDFDIGAKYLNATTENKILKVRIEKLEKDNAYLEIKVSSLRKKYNELAETMNLEPT